MKQSKLACFGVVNGLGDPTWAVFRSLWWLNFAPSLGTAGPFGDVRA